MWEVAVTLCFVSLAFFFTYLAFYLAPEYRHFRNLFFLLTFAMFILAFACGVLLVDTTASTSANVIVLLNAGYYVLIPVLFFIFSIFFLNYLKEVIGYLQVRFGKKQ